MICMFSHWVEAFPCHQAIARDAAKFLLQKILSTWGVPQEIHSDQATHLTELIIQAIGKIWSTYQHSPCTYHPQSSGLAESITGTIKIQLVVLAGAATCELPTPSHCHPHHVLRSHHLWRALGTHLLWAVCKQNSKDNRKLLCSEH